MSTLIAGSQLRAITLGQLASVDVALSGAATHQLFTVTGGEVLITALWAKCTTTMAAANTLNVQTDPTTGDTVVAATATDLGTTDTAAGTVIGFVLDQDGTTNIPLLVKGQGEPLRIVVTTGEVESVVTGSADGALTWYATWVPLTEGAELTASTG